VGLLLNMTGHEKATLVGVAIGILIHVILSSLFIPAWGAMGAALAASGCLLILNLVLVILVRRRLGLDSTAFGRPPRRRVT
jgi:O-antigen/teichoic acid export membrane protein